MLVLRTRPLAGRPYVPRELASRVSVWRTLRAGEARAPLMARAAIFVPAAFGRERLRVEAAAAGAAIADPDGVEAQPELAAAAMARLAEDDSYRARRAELRAEATAASFREVAARLDGLYGSLGTRRRAARATATRSATGPGSSPTSHAHPVVARLLDRGRRALDHAEAEGLGAIAVTDHNVSAARSRRSSSRTAT